MHSTLPPSHHPSCSRDAKLGGQPRRSMPSPLLLACAGKGRRARLLVRASHPHPAVPSFQLSHAHLLILASTSPDPPCTLTLHCPHATVHSSVVALPWLAWHSMHRSMMWLRQMAHCERASEGAEGKRHRRQHATQRQKLAASAPLQPPLTLSTTMSHDHRQTLFHCVDTHRMRQRAVVALPTATAWARRRRRCSSQPRRASSAQHAPS